MRNLLFTIFTVLMVMAFANDKNRTVEKRNPKVTVKGKTKAHKIIMGIPKKYPNDAVQIQKAVLKDDKVTLTVSYSGGAKKHEFKLYASKGIKESYPAQIHVVLSHNANGDAAEAYITRDVIFDISVLKKHAPIVLHIRANGMKKAVSVTLKK